MSTTAQTTPPPTTPPQTTSLPTTQPPTTPLATTPPATTPPLTTPAQTIVQPTTAFPNVPLICTGPNCDRPLPCICPTALNRTATVNSVCEGYESSGNSFLIQACDNVINVFCPSGVSDTSGTLKNLFDDDIEDIVNRNSNLLKVTNATQAKSAVPPCDVLADIPNPFPAPCGTTFNCDTQLSNCACPNLTSDDTVNTFCPQAYQDQNLALKAVCQSILGIGNATGKGCDATVIQDGTVFVNYGNGLDNGTSYCDYFQSLINSPIRNCSGQCTDALICVCPQAVNFTVTLEEVCENANSSGNSLYKTVCNNKINQYCPSTMRSQPPLKYAHLIGELTPDNLIYNDNQKMATRETAQVALNFCDILVDIPTPFPTPCGASFDCNTPLSPCPCPNLSDPTATIDTLCTTSAQAQNNSLNQVCGFIRLVANFTSGNGCQANVIQSGTISIDSGPFMSFCSFFESYLNSQVSTERSVDTWNLLSYIWPSNEI